MILPTSTSDNPPEKTGVIYRICNKINSKSYIGQTIHPKRRMRNHLNSQSKVPALHNAVQKYGKGAFQAEIIQADIPYDDLDAREIYWIAHFNSVAPNGYNLKYGGGGAIPSLETRKKIGEARKGIKHSLESRKKISEVQKGKTLSLEHRSKISEANKGKTRTLETCRKISEVSKGRLLSPETRRKISEANKGKTHSLEARRKLSEAGKGRSLSPEHRRKLSEANKGEKNHNFGKYPSPETRRKISESNKGRNVSPETRRKISEALKGRPVSCKTRQYLSEAHKRPEYNEVRTYYFLALPPNMPLREKRKNLYRTFSDINRDTICRWVRDWESRCA